MSILRERFTVAHLSQTLVVHPEDGLTFGIYAGDAAAPAARALASGHVGCAMVRELRALAHRIEALQGAAFSQ